uniref:Nas2 N-terminal domain-containing protein n=1 Tax=Felis catus TaxID=9685 RepID=A0ABI7Z136_FELCA
MSEEVWPAGGSVAVVPSGVRSQEAGKPGVQDTLRRSRMSEEQTGQSEGSSQAGGVTVSDIQELIRRKEEIEAQIKANYDVLESQKGVGMSEPLVDCEGYPRSDVDLYQVRTARHNIVSSGGACVLWLIAPSVVKASKVILQLLVPPSHLLLSLSAFLFHL